MRATGTAGVGVSRIYLTILSRYPTDDEVNILRRIAMRFGQARPPRAVVDLAWALINSAEFLYRH